MSSSQNTASIFSTNSGADASVFELLHPDLLGLFKSKLQQAAEIPDLFTQVFGDKANTVELQTVRSQWSVGDFRNLPSVQILSAANTNGAVGAYVNQTVYLSDALFQPNAAPTSSVFGAAGVLVEETFHFLDSLVGSDTEGDEGEYAKDLIFGVSLNNNDLNRVRSEDDRGFISVGDQQVLAELAFDYAGNTLGTARAITLGSSTTTFRDWVGSADTNDYYRFSVANTSNLNLSLNGLSADADVQLLNASGGLIQSSANSGTSAESIIRQVNAGTYYIRVFPYSSGSTYYNLNASVVPVAPPPTTAADWTFLVYLAADNDLERFGVDDFLEMASVGSTRNVNVVVQFDRASGYDTRYGNWTDTRRGLVSRNDTPTQNWGTSIGEANMGDQSTLTNFINWGMANYRANNYAVVLWNHGGGIDGIAYDERSNNDRLELREVSGSLASLSRNIDLLGTDACLMGMVEFAHQIRDNASVLVASEEVIPGQGWNYTTVLSDLTANSRMTANQLGTVMVDRYGQFYRSQGNNGFEETLSAIDLVNLRASNANNLSARLSQFATTFMNTSTASDRSKLNLYRSQSASFDQRPDNRDLGTLLSKLSNDSAISSGIRVAAQSALSAYNSLIIRNYSSISGRGTGLAITLQARGSSVSSYYTSSNLAFARDTTWDEFLRWWRTA